MAAVRAAGRCRPQVPSCLSRVRKSTWRQPTAGPTGSAERLALAVVSPPRQYTSASMCVEARPGGALMSDVSDAGGVPGSGCVA